MHTANWKLPTAAENYGGCIGGGSWVLGRGNYGGGAGSWQGYSEKLHLQSYLEMLGSKTGCFGILGNNIILVIILLDLIER